MTAHLDNAAVQDILRQNFAPWVQALDFMLTATSERGTAFSWAVGPDVVRPMAENAPGVVSGQAIMAAADTLSVLTIAALNGGFRPCTTIDLHCNWLRPLFAGPCPVEVDCIGFGRQLVTTRVTFYQGEAGKLAATATASFLYL